jgi:hypothetical protein
LQQKPGIRRHTQPFERMRSSAHALIRSAFGLPCWQVRWDNQVGLDLNLGAPHLVVREPHSSTSGSARVRALAGRRRVHLHGTHWLWIAAEAWGIRLPDGTVARRSSSARQCDIACARLTGEQLTEVRIDLRCGATEFHFDLGGVIRVRCPRGWGDEPDDELWMLHGPRKRCVAVFAGATYAFGSTVRSDKPVSPIRRRGEHITELVI